MSCCWWMLLSTLLGFALLEFAARCRYKWSDCSTDRASGSARRALLFRDCLGCTWAGSDGRWHASCAALLPLLTPRPWLLPLLLLRVQVPVESREGSAARRGPASRCSRRPQVIALYTGHGCCRSVLQPPLSLQPGCCGCSLQGRPLGGQAGWPQGRSSLAHGRQVSCIASTVYAHVHY